MKRQLIRLILITLAFEFIFPHIEGIQVHGLFVHLFVAALFFALLGWLVEIIAVAVSAIVTVGTLGLALLIDRPAVAGGILDYTCLCPETVSRFDA